MSRIATFSGRLFDPVSPSPDDIDLVDIAHALSNLCRFNGHCRHFYSVAQHSVLVSELFEGEEARIGLLHDATEAYLADVPRPVKPHLTNYDELEERLWRVIAGRFSLPPTMPASIAEADLRLLATERRDLMADGLPGWAELNRIEPLPQTIEPWSPMEAKARFIAAFERLFRDPFQAPAPATRPYE